MSIQRLAHISDVDWGKLLSPYSDVVIIADTTVATLHLAALQKAIGRQQMHALSMPAGEVNKNRQTKAMLEDALLAKRVGRDACLIALGGGVVTDMVGFVAATYLRGVDVIYVPTTLMGMIDAAIGGKTAINTPYGKNTLGVIRMPKTVMVAPHWLRTLPQDAYQYALAEALKHALIADQDYWAFMQSHAQGVLAREEALLNQLIDQSIAIKSRVVEEDLHDHGCRAFLNVGHTLGHALEKSLDYQLPHGLAVAWGLRVEIAYSVRLGHMSSSVGQAIEHTLSQYGLLYRAKVDAQRLLAACQGDKKRRQHKITLPLVKDIACMVNTQGQSLHALDEKVLLTVLQEASLGLLS